MKAKRFGFILLAAGLLAACQTDDLTVSTSENNLVRISPAITRATESNFEAGDQIGLTIAFSKETYVSNVCLTYSDDVFAGDLIWYDSNEGTSTLTAYYPYSSAGAPESFSVSTDQSADGAYEASDLLASVKKSAPTSNAVSMVFSHLMTKIQMTVVNTTSSAVSSVALAGSVPAATVDLANLSAVADETASAAEIKAQEITAGSSYRAIVVPQTVALELVVTTDDGNSYSAPLATSTLVGGSQYTVYGRLTKSGLSITSEDSSDWEDEDADLQEHLDENYIIYHGETYKTVTLSNGTTWMAENMRYVPDGYTVSSDPTSGSIWYPYELDYAQAVEDNAVSTNLDASYIVVLTDDESIAKYGYLYNFETVMGGVALSEDNWLTVEDSQGICPDGWHIPNRAEYYDVVGTTNSNTNFGEASSAKTYSEALLWDSEAGYGTVVNALANSFMELSGYVNTSSTYGRTVCHSGNCGVEDYYGEIALSYYWSSTGRSATQAFGLMTTFTTTYGKGRLSMAYANATYGCALRCIKDHDIDFYAAHTDIVSPAAYAATMEEE